TSIWMGSWWNTGPLWPTVPYHSQSTRTPSTSKSLSNLGLKCFQPRQEVIPLLGRHLPECRLRTMKILIVLEKSCSYSRRSGTAVGSEKVLLVIIRRLSSQSRKE